MTRSMTAYAREQNSAPWGEAAWEIRSVNHRYLDLSVRLPEDWRALESPVRERVGKRIKRGKVECSLRVRTSAGPGSDLTLNRDLAAKLVRAAQAIAQLDATPGEAKGGAEGKNLGQANTLAPLAMGELLRWPGVLEASAPDADTVTEVLLGLFDKALDDFVAAREREGGKLEALLLERCDAIEAIVTELTPRIPEIIDAQRTKMRERLADFGTEVDHGRIEQELVIYAQKIDVTEEMDRLAAHVGEVRRVLGQRQPVGRRLDFLMQELNREANTLGSKSVSLSTTSGSVDLKVLIEQMREQIQNLE